MMTDLQAALSSALETEMYDILVGPDGEGVRHFDERCGRLADAILAHPAMKDVVILDEDIEYPEEVVWGRFACRLCGRERYGDD